MRISSRALQSLLAGDITSQQFNYAHGFVGDLNPFKDQMDAGHMIKSIGIERSADYDDDWLVFQFGTKRDPAISNFEVNEGDEEGS